ncbi:MAG: EpsG family protein [Lachnospiraceae bacterium]|nr:EpsG family protein [Lachnospiraceae bacterium]
MQGVILYLLLFGAGMALASGVGRVERAGAGSRQQAADRVLLAGLFLLLFVPAALRIYTGNDYRTYIVRFHDVNVGNYVVTEPGFNLLVKGIYAFLGDEYFLVVFAVFAFATVLLFLAGIYAQSRDFALSFFLFMALGMYFQTYNTVRYYFALALVFCSMHYMAGRRYEKFVLLVLSAALFHKTALVVLPAYLLARMRWKKWYAAVLAVISLSGLVLRTQYMALFLRLYPSYLEEEEYLAGGDLSIVNILRCVAVLLLCAVFYAQAVSGDETVAFYMKLNILALVMYGFFSFVPFVSRIGYYFNISQILLIPRLLRSLPERSRKVLYAVTAVAGLLYFALFLYKASDIYIKILPYATWLSESGPLVPVY